MPWPYRPAPLSTLESRLALGLVLAAAAVLLVLVLRLLLPWLGLGAVGAGAWLLWRRRQAQEQARYRLFYDLIDRHQGCLTVFTFARAANLSGQAARTFLDARAKEFCASFEPTDSGDVLYRFPVVPLSLAPDRTPDLTSEQAGHLAHRSAPTDLASAGLSAPALALRLGCTPHHLQAQTRSPRFAIWAASQDPHHQGWCYDPDSQRYYPTVKYLDQGPDRGADRDPTAP